MWCVLLHLSLSSCISLEKLITSKRKGGTMATQTVSLDHPEIVVEKKECEEVKTMEEVVVSPPKGMEEKVKDDNSGVKDMPIEPLSVEGETKSGEERPKIAEPEEKLDEKPKDGDLTTSPAKSEEKLKDEDLVARPTEPEEKVEVKSKAEDSTARPGDIEEKVDVKSKAEDSTSQPDSEEKVEDNNTQTCEDKVEVSSGVSEQVAESVEIKAEEKIEIESSKNDAIEEKTEELTKKSIDVQEPLVDDVVKQEEEVKEVLPEKETEAATEKAAETSEVEYIKDVIPEEEKSAVAPAVSEEPKIDPTEIVAKEVEVEVERAKETCSEKVDGAELLNEKAKDAVDEPAKEKIEVESELKTEEKKGEETEGQAQVIEKEVETMDGKIEKSAETIKPAIEEVAEAISLAEKPKDIGLLTKKDSLNDEKVSDLENKVGDEAAAASKDSPSSGDLLKPQTEENEQENVNADIEKEDKVEVAAKLDDVTTDKSTEDIDTNKETLNDTRVEDVPVTKSKQSNNILTKMKKTLVKAKKAIIGKSPSSKTISTNSEIKT